MRRFLTLVLCLLLTGAVWQLHAATITFTGGGDGTSWEDPANWDTGTVPTPADDVIITNANAVTISTFVTANSVRVNMTASLTVQMVGTLYMSRVTSNSNMLQLNDNAQVTNNGIVTAILASGNSVDLNNASTFVNNGSLGLFDPSGDPINMEDSSSFTNNGTIIGTEGNDAIEMEDMTTFYNYGDIYMNDFSDEGIEMDASTTFENYGYLNITDVTNDLICLDGSGDHFINYGEIDLFDAGDRAIEIDDGRLTNADGGTINIDNADGGGIYLQSNGEFDNYGAIDIAVNANSSGDEGIELQSNTLFRNFSTIDIEVSGNNEANALFLGSSTSILRNEECGVINMTSQHRMELDSGSELINEGVLATVYSGTHDNRGDLQNNGLIIAPNGFMIAPNPVSGSGTITMSGSVPATSACAANAGSIGCSGTTTYDAATASYTQTADGCYYDSPFTMDEISYFFQTVCGNGEIIARVTDFSGQGWGGVTMRETLDANSKKVQLMINQSQFARREARSVTGGPAYPQQFPAFGYNWVRLERTGNVFRGYISPNGGYWRLIMTVLVPMDACLEVGLVSTNYNQFNSSTTVTFDNLTIDSDTPLVGAGAANDVALENVAQQIAPQQNGAETNLWQAYPNPTSGMVTLSLNAHSDQPLSLRVLNAVGQQVREGSILPLETPRYEVDLTGLPNGIYSFQLMDAEGQLQTKKVSLQGQ